MVMRSSVTAAVVAGLISLRPGAAEAQPPDPAALRRAEQDFEAGARAYRAKQFELAASQFEAAHTAAPSAQALRMAIRARDEAGQPARAATLAAFAAESYPDDAKTAELAQAVLDRLGPALHRIEIECVTACVLAVGSLAVLGPPATKRTLYLSPGEVPVAASFAAEGRGAREIVQASAGGASTLRLAPVAEPEPEPKPAPEAKPEPAPPPAPPPEPPAPKLVPKPEPAPPKPALLPPPAADVAPGEGLSPVAFFVGLGATGVLGALTVWSGIDTINSPGQDAVRESCRGQGATCPEYQEGLANQTRTNVLIGATAGAAALTAALGLLFTDWSATQDSGPAAALWVGPEGAAVEARVAF
ncbi:MAG: hypothetical protein HY744_33290 [Deltaproteobacteria bacterium]|nr:hypothetical protein [Deltaproteobacteria bacterium]